MEYVFSLPLADGIELIRRAREADLDERLHLQWAIQLPTMAMSGEYVSFADYKKRLTGGNIDTRPTADILREIADIEAQFRKKEE